MKTIEEVLDLAEKLNEMSPETGYISVKIEGLIAEEIKSLCDQENGSYFTGSCDILPSDWGSVQIGKVEFILSSKKIVKTKSIF